MSGSPVFQPWYQVDVAEPEEVYLLSEQGTVLLKGALYCQLAPLLDGRHTADDIVEALMGEVQPAEVYYALTLLTQQGYITEADPDIPLARSAFWHALKLDARAAERRLRAATVTHVAFGDVPVESCAAALGASGIRVGEPGDFAVVLTDDYLAEELREFNATALASGRPWLLVKPVGTQLWIGPTFRPGQTACWECLAQRLRLNHGLEATAKQHRKVTTLTPPSSARAALPATAHLAIRFAITETIKEIARGWESAGDSFLTALDVRTMETQKHFVSRRPQCPSCGAASVGAVRDSVPLTLTGQSKRFTSDGGHRVVSPEQTVARYQHHVSPITGAVRTLTQIPVDDDHLIQVYRADYSYPIRAEGPNSSQQNMRGRSSGKGMTDAQARASGLCEALERYSGGFHGDEIRRRSTYRRLGQDAIHPNTCLLFSDAQYANRRELNSRGSKFDRVPAEFDENASIDWTPAWSLTARAFKYLPTAYCYYGYPLSAEARFCWADSNGNAAGNTPEEAILQGFMELVERDSVALWWYNRVRRPALDLDSFDEPYIRDLKRQYGQRGREFWVLDLTSDLEIPVFAAISPVTDAAPGRIILGFGAHFDPRIALLRALTELNQMLGLLTAADRVGVDGETTFEDPYAREWWGTATLGNQPYLVPDDTAPCRTRADYAECWSSDLRDDLILCQQIVEQRGLEMIVLDQTRPDIGLPVLKVIVPGLRHFWARYAPGRLYDVPAQLGWLERPSTEAQLNRIPMFY